MLEKFCRHAHGILCKHFPDREFQLDAEAGTIRCGDVRMDMSSLFDEYPQNLVSLAEFDRLIIKNFSQALKLMQSPMSHASARRTTTAERLVYYAASLLVGQLESGGDYHQLRPYPRRQFAEHLCLRAAQQKRLNQPFELLAHVAILVSLNRQGEPLLKLLGRTEQGPG